MKYIKAIVFILLLVTLFSCAKEADKLPRMNIEEIYSLSSSPIDFDTYGNILFIAEQNQGFSILNSRTSELVNIQSGLEMDSLGNVLPGLVSIYDVRVIRYYAPLQTLFVNDRTAGQRIYVSKYEPGENTLSPFRNFIGRTSEIRDILFEESPVRPESFVYYWGYWMNSRNNLRRAEYNTLTHDYRDFAIMEEIPNAVNSFVSTDTHLIMAMGQRGLYITDKDLNYFSEFAVPGDARDLKLKGDILLVANRSAGVHIIDIRDINEPVIISHIEISGNSISIDYYRDYLAIGTTSNGVYLYNIANLSQPKIIDHIRQTVTGDIFKVKFSGDELFVACHQGMVKLRIKN